MSNEITSKNIRSMAAKLDRIHGTNARDAKALLLSLAAEREQSPAVVTDEMVAKLREFQLDLARSDGYMADRLFAILSTEPVAPIQEQLC